MNQNTINENSKLTYGVSSAQVRQAIQSVFVLSDLTHLKVDRRFEDNLHIESAREMYCGICMAHGIDWIEAVEHLEISEDAFSYRFAQFRKYEDMWEVGDWTPRVIAFNRRLCSVKRKLENLVTGY